MLALVLVVAAGGCDLTGSIAVSPQGVADVELEIGIERDLIDDPSLDCEQVMSGALDGILAVEAGPGVVEDVSGGADSDELRCRLADQVSLPQAGWDGQSGAPLWSAEPTSGNYRFLVPLSQGTGSGSVSQEDIDRLGVDATVSVSVTMPAPVTWASQGTIDGDTVTVTGVRSMMTDLDIRTGSQVPSSGGAMSGPSTWMVVTVIVGACLLLGAAALVLDAILRRRGESGRNRQGGGRPA